MKHRSFLARSAAMLLAFTALPLSAATLNWGSSYLSQFSTSNGQQLSSNYSFELGFFADSFVPTMANLGEWEENWRTFDVGNYDPVTGYFTGTADLRADGSSSSAWGAQGVDFANQNAYVWVHNSLVPGPEMEWFLGRSESWIFPSAPEEDCCDGRLPFQFSLSDLSNGDTPVMGAHGNVAGGGTVAAPGIYDLQTYTLPVPEPGAMVLVFASLGVALRRRRSD